MPNAPVFHDRNAAAQNLARVREHLPDALVNPLLRLLEDSPDPDGALNLFERLTASASRELFRAFERHPFLMHSAVVVFGYSRYLGETLIQNPDLFTTLLREKNLDHTRTREEFAEVFARARTRSLETNMSLLLARFKRRQYVRILLRDALKLATLAEGTAEISALSDVLIEEALRDSEMRLHNRYGPAQTLDAHGRLVVIPFTVLALGKLGGNELNYSSDIDLLFLHGDGEAPPQATISNHEYFVRLAQMITETLSAGTKEGATFRLDLRLRPEGGDGEPVVSLSHALDYYAHRARDWELQAMIKVRHSGGDQGLAREFIRWVQPHVYTPDLNFAAIETALMARKRMARHRLRGAAELDIKRDRGGIRDIEFLVQCLQRVYGGAEPWLRSGGTLFSLQKLHDKKHIGSRDFQVLTSAYEFLRALEHRLQLRHGQQTHRLPSEPRELAVLARMMSTPTAALAQAAASPADFPDLVRTRMNAVAEIYNRIIHQQQTAQSNVAEARTDPAWERKPGAPETLHRQLLDRLSSDAPEWHRLLSEAGPESQIRRNIVRFLSAASTGPERRAALSAPVPCGILEIFARSEFLVDMLVREPRLLGLLSRPDSGWKNAPGAPASISSGTFTEPTASSSSSESTGSTLSSPFTASLTEKMALLRRSYQGRLFAVAASDIVGRRNVWTSLAETTAAADDTIRQALAYAEPPPQLAVFALGRLGTEEHDLLSDADLIFVRTETVDPTEARQSAQRVIDILSSYTKEGIVFPVDARLRPHGSEGDLVITPAQLQNYFLREAHAWEALTYAKLRFIAGSAALAQQAMAARQMLLRHFAALPEFPADALAMRLRLEKAASQPEDIKSGHGGLYDIDFLAGSRLIRHLPGTPFGPLRQRLETLRQHGVLEENDFVRLTRNAEFLRTVEHVIWLVTGHRRKSLPVTEPARSSCERLCRAMLSLETPGDLESILRSRMAEVRQDFKRIGL